MELRVSTSDLQTLLKNNDELRMQFDKYAAEKIAEEMAKKMTGQMIERMTDQAFKGLESRVKSHIQMAEANIVRGIGWPDGLEQKIQAKAQEYLRDQRVAMIDEFRVEVTKVLQQAEKDARSNLDELMATTFGQYKDNMRDIAREGFFEAIREAQALKI